MRVPGDIWSTVSRNVKVLILQSCSPCLIFKSTFLSWSSEQGPVGFPGASVVKNSQANTGEAGDCLILGQEEPLEEEAETHPSILAGKIPWPEEPVGLVCGVSRS